MNGWSFGDGDLQAVGQWILTAGAALRSFYVARRASFVRDTVHVDDPAPTSTHRAFFALYEFLRFLEEEDLGNSPDSKETIQVVCRVASRYLQMAAAGRLSRLRRSKDNDENMFTDAHLLIAASVLPGLENGFPINVNVRAIKRVLRSRVARPNLNLLKSWGGGKIHEADDVHDFVTLYMVRALDVFDAGPIGDALGPSSIRLRDRVKQDVLRLLAYHAAGISSKFDATELVFGIALLNRFPTPDTEQLTEQSLKAIVKSQADDGAWPTARVVSYQPGRLLHVASYEVALVLTELMMRQSCARFRELVFPALKRVFELVRSHYDRQESRHGWANDHTRRNGLVESWATAIVLGFLVRYRDFLRDTAQREVLARYNAAATRTTVDGTVSWPDLLSSMPWTNRVEFGPLASVSDPTSQRRLSGRVRTDMLVPIQGHWLQRPSVVSVLLYGPPGTRKTSFVRAMAGCLGWPLLTLTPPDFLRNGLDGFEAVCAGIFRDLALLRRVVVFFDECEDFFRARPSKQRVESRTTGAFITAGMLPRLQGLHDSRWVIFVVATNSDPEELDEAAIRRGRFDRADRFDHPSLAAQTSYIANRVSGRQLRQLSKALLEYQAKMALDRELGPVSFAILDELVEKFRNGPIRGARVEAFLSFEGKRKGPPSLASRTSRTR